MKRRLAVPLGAVILLALLTWTQPQQNPPFGAWITQTLPGKCLIWMPDLDGEGPLRVHDCDDR